MDYIYVSLSDICAVSRVILFHIFMFLGLPNAKYKLLSNVEIIDSQLLCISPPISHFIAEK
jgi:hypothetical protein